MLVVGDLYGESTNKTDGRVWIALYVKLEAQVSLYRSPDINKPS
jgi:hypothetical protein